MSFILGGAVFYAQNDIQGFCFVFVVKSVAVSLTPFTKAKQLS